MKIEIKRKIHNHQNHPKHKRKKIIMIIMIIIIIIIIIIQYNNNQECHNLRLFCNMN